ncbi:pimeloyl-ACP methyl ester carboxylesterase [Knoellia remsis]|uniref:Pimeloyl-ACP methyl ester carboxylesterase n=1 Tax=Knoellia remsis TaxID=407159 RepID=A0A2T0UFB9_9MICO|nr:alpha/beta fold hydrolase [Knoellia remsis]PRY56630.1 pimeloyl-ACP methyl ester carboxylesterase [Knoellia remsis]
MREFTRDGLTFDVTDTGPEDGEVVMLLHGWPQDRGTWDAVGRELTAEGLRVVAFDQRGYSPRARPRERAAYAMKELVADVVAAIDATGAEKVHLVGHDWGGAVAWAFAEQHPERLHSVMSVSVPHHRAFAAALRRPQQARMSWYMAAFQVPKLPEAFLGRRLYAVLRGIGLPREEAKRYAARFREPGAAAGGLAWYRALPLGGDLMPGPRELLPRRLRGARGGSDGAGTRRIQVPATLLWGSKDPALGREAAEATARWVDADYRFVEVDGGHWLPETEPALVARTILDRVRPTP